MTTLRLFLPYLHPYRGRLLIAILCSLGMAATDLLRPWPLKIIVDQVVLHHHTPHAIMPIESLLLFVTGGQHSALLIGAAALIILTALTNGLFDFTQSYLTASVGQRIIFDLRRTLYAYIQRLPIPFHDGARKGDLLSRLTTDVQNLQLMIISGVLLLVSNVLTLAGMIIVLIVLDWQFALIALSLMPFLLFLSVRYTRMIKQSLRVSRLREGDVASIAQETLSAIRVVQAFNTQDYEDQRLEERSLSSLEASVRATTLQAQMTPLINVGVAIGTALVVYIGAQQVLSNALSLGNLMVFLSYLATMYGPIRQIAKLNNTITRGTTSAERIADILMTPPTVIDLPNATAAPQLSGQICLEHVSFGYRPEHPVLRDVDVTIQPGQVIALVGATGAGKSSIASLLLRFYDPTLGRITVDGQDIRSFTIGSLRDQIAVVFQESVLFHTTIRDNIAYGNPSATMEDIMAVARQANAHEFIMRQPQGYETVVGERGDTLSGGQRQRIAIARAMLRDAPILILDEPTSALDAAAEQSTLQALDRLQKGRTTIVIAHRLSTIRHADQILVLERGRIVERGTHLELLRQNGVYSLLYTTQFNGSSGLDVRLPEAALLTS